MRALFCLKLGNHILLENSNVTYHLDIEILVYRILVNHLNVIRRLRALIITLARTSEPAGLHRSNLSTTNASKCTFPKRQLRTFKLLERRTFRPVFLPKYPSNVPTTSRRVLFQIPTWRVQSRPSCRIP